MKKMECNICDICTGSQNDDIEEQDITIRFINNANVRIIHG